MSIYGRPYSPRKAMGMGKGESGASDVKPFPMGTPHPDMSSGAAMKSEMGDGDRAVGAPMSAGAGQMPAQAAPDHGPHYERQMGFRRGAKA